MNTRRNESLPVRLLNEAHSIEALLDDTDPPPEQLEQYWDVSARLLRLVIDIEEFAKSPNSRGVTAHNTEFIHLRRTLSNIESEVLGLSDG